MSLLKARLLRRFSPRNDMGFRVSVDSRLRGNDRWCGNYRWSKNDKWNENGRCRGDRDTIYMSRVRANIIVDGKSFWALFDGGARNTYVTEKVASLLPVFELEKAESVGLGGEVRKVEKECLLKCVVGGFPIRTRARILDKIGEDEEGKAIEVLIGALAMQEWSIIPIPAEERVDMSHYPKEFVEY